MSLNPARLSSLSEKLDAADEARLLSEKQKEEEKIKSSKKPSPKKLKGTK